VRCTRSTIEESEKERDKERERALICVDFFAFIEGKGIFIRRCLRPEIGAARGKQKLRVA
jgi:hypothetical protein